MINQRDRKPISEWAGESIAPGESKDVFLELGESYSSLTVRIPIHIHRAKEDGPVVFITAALHGDEINGTGAVRQIIQDPDFELLKGSLILVPVLNILGFDRHSRYLPDRRDLNRCFPGMAGGSLASRMAYQIFNEIVTRSDYGIDLHTASVRRTNYPNVRADMNNPAARELAEWYGSEIILDGLGPKGGFRREASKAGCPTIIMEGGEVWKVEPSIVESAMKGIRNVLQKLGMLDVKYDPPKFQVVIEKSKWIRAEKGGFLQFHVSPGDMVEKDQPLVTNTTLLGDEQNMLFAPFDGVIIGMTSLPAISPGEPICNIGKLPKGRKPDELEKMRVEEDGLEQWVSEELSSNVLVVEPSPELYDQDEEE
ncbi:MAG: succinylglutamate desuccinylase/aspartoacylase family protein [FCB group bacterium]|nr:succinylglutamate desuccinylase/aspartoacylase family protein [FCB group bacterium]MBL7029445.1 succinylglutamate desuccinylase/aspartoacylase family protein [Candidatus Neomarinimicrobiota bacterium]